MDGDRAVLDWRESLGLRDESFQAAIASFLEEAGLEGDFSLHLIGGGANNRIYRVEVGNALALLKVYFQHPDDPRDRQGAEFSFSRFAWGNGLRCLPKPLACDPQNRLGLYEFVHGRLLLLHEVTEGVVREALNFYCELNRHKRLPSARALPRASEACFALAEHLQCVERRVQNLRDMDTSSAIDREASGFVQDELSKVWLCVRDLALSRCYELGLALDGNISQEDRCLSPSDFGFHNALLTDGGSLRFFDFEYAGWDDPAKMVCDFFCQPAVPVPLDYYDMFAETVVSDLSEPEMHLQRIAVLLPLYRLKWCCILLNDFLPVGIERRRFAYSAVDQEERKVKQLQKARDAVQSLSAWRAKSEVRRKYLSEP
jgi:hypothetical protein